jgi:hypothetical protein
MILTDAAIYWLETLAEEANGRFTTQHGYARSVLLDWLDFLRACRPIADLDLALQVIDVQTEEINALKSEQPGEQPSPTTNPNSRLVTEALIDLLRERSAKGIETYGTPLMTHNGRDAQRDALEEALDLCQYLMQMKMEEEDSAHAGPSVCAGHANGQSILASHWDHIVNAQKAVTGLEEHFVAFASAQNATIEVLTKRVIDLEARITPTPPVEPSVPVSELRELARDGLESTIGGSWSALSVDLYKWKALIAKAEGGAK